MRRSALLAVALCAAAGTSPAGAQQAGKTYRVGVLFLDVVAALRPYLDAIRQSLAGLGYREGQNLEIVIRDAGGDSARLPALASDLVRAKPDVIVAGTLPALAALKRATTSVPIVMANQGNPVRNGLISGLAKPGGNITGVSNMGVDLTGKQLQLLKEVVPRLSLVVFVIDASIVGSSAWNVPKIAAGRLGLQSLFADIGSVEFEQTLERVAHERRGSAGVLALGLVPTSIARLVRITAALGLPGMYAFSDYVVHGGLMSYGASEVGLWRQAAIYVDRILKGAKPGDLPVQQPTSFELAVNLKTAHALGLTVPQSILLQATQVIR